jgi:hypothetical protein
VGTPRDAEAVSSLLRDRPDGWEYLLYAGTMLVERDACEDVYRDHLLRHVRPRGPALDDEAAVQRLRAALPDLQASVDAAMALFDPRVQQRAFGPPGTPGDAGLIQQLATRTVDAYRQFIDWGADLRSTRVPLQMRRAYGLAADLARQPVEDIRSFIDAAVAAMDDLPRQLAEDTDEPINVDLTLVLTLDENLAAEYSREVERIIQPLRSRGRPRRRRWLR